MGLSQIGVHRHVIGDAERGKASTGIGIYAGLLWALGLTGQLARVADPETDDEGLARSRDRDRTRAGARKVLDDDF